MAYEFRFEKRVEFSETDLAGILHFSNMFRYMEMAEHAFYRSLGLSVLENGDPQTGWPRVHASCDYFEPLRFEETARIHVLVSEKRASSIHYLFIISKLRGDEVVQVARGRSSAVFVRFDQKTGKMVSAPIPDNFGSSIESAPEGVLSQYRNKKED